MVFGEGSGQQPPLPVPVRATGLIHARLRAKRENVLYGCDSACTHRTPGQTDQFPRDFLRFPAQISLQKTSFMVR